MSKSKKGKGLKALPVLGVASINGQPVAIIYGKKWSKRVEVAI